MEFKLDSREAAKLLQKNMADLGKRVFAAMQGAAEDAADQIMERGRADIAAGGNFGDDWLEGLQSKVSGGGGAYNIETSMDGPPPVSYWKVFEYGANISAHNASGYLWLPFTDAEKGIWPSQYSGDLFRATSKAGTPLLGDKDTKEWKYFGLPSVTIPQKFHLRDVLKQVAKEIRGYYEERMNG